MSILTYLGKVFNGLPAYDSEDLIAAKEYHPSFSIHDLSSKYDLYSRKTDPFMFGAIAPENDENDLLESKELEKIAGEIYKLYSK